MSRRDLPARLLAVTLFAALFFTVWQPLRSALAVHAVAPLLEVLAGIPVEAVASPPSVRAPGAPSVPAYSIPAGLHFLVPGLLLVAVAPRRRYWLVLLGVLLALGLGMLGLFALGLAGVPGGFAVNGLLQAYVVPSVSLGVPLFLLTREPQPATFNAQPSTPTT